MVDRRAIAEELLGLKIKLRDTGIVPEIEDLQEKLKVLAETEGDGFTEEFGEGRHVKVSAPSESKFKGKVPKLVPEMFYDVSKARQEKLVADGMVIEVIESTEARRPSVTVKF